MDNETISILQSFRRPLPDVETADVSYRHVTSAAPSNPAQDAIPLLQRESNEELLGLAAQALQTQSKQPALQQNMPLHEASHYLGTEGDILRISALQLIHPINAVLSLLIPNGAKLLCRAEVTSPDQTPRTNLKWIYIDPSGQDQVVAILEYKNTGVIHFENWAGAITLPENAVERLLNAKEQINSTFLVGNAIILSKQLVNYESVCSDIALFDWNNMMVFDFAETNEDLLVPKFTSVVFESDPLHFRSLLLGMIVRSLKRRGII
ncbi:predicted protein [Uncinocarpus reesii 1704]|uniref:Uncharacterized protein n=1 Tax=Uncinocarpus reesii (strain UAMH 1704) TaxID=336963 RepID=C4JHN2_UNCRE|nr:uncharacterized protein UREG_02718 [Uncinocarpus reesii 1704]EEP77869.1 predicted protein [Uncinocarpus reesii 1704]